MLNYKDYYKFSGKMLRGELRVTSLEEYFISAHDFISCQEEPKTEPIFVHEMGGRIYDVLPTTNSGIYLVSIKFISVLESNHFSGWATNSIKAYDKDNNRIDNYYVFKVKGKAGPHDKSMSEDIMIQYPGRSVLGKKGLYFEPETYDGSDIFILKNSLHIIMHFKVKECLEKAKITNAEFTNLTEYKYSWF
jgi:hypothetical protein